MVKWLNSLRFKIGNWKLKILLPVFSFSFLFFRSISPPSALAANPLSYTITVSATIGESKLSLFGYTSPFSQVHLQGIGIAEKAAANEKGYFFFDRVFLPKPKMRIVHPGDAHAEGAQTAIYPAYPELCLTSIDSQKRLSFPTCLPPLPIGSFDIKVGPVLLPPTINLDKGFFRPEEQVKAEGFTIPNSEVTIFLANGKANKNYFKTIIDLLRFGSISINSSFIKKIYAYSLPQYQTQSDKNGHFELNLPDNQSAVWRIFAGASYSHSLTPKSNTLTFTILSWRQLFLEKMFSFFALFKLRFWPLLIAAEAVIIVLLLIKKRRLQKSIKKPDST